MTRLLSDVRLARQASEGDQRAFSAIYARYHQDIYRFCLSIVGRPEDAEDALQGTMVKALQALPGERREIQLKPWLYRVAHNEAIDLLRRRREGDELVEEQLSRGAELAETVALRERLGRLLGDLGELPSRQRSALVMRELGGLSYDQIGEAFESSPAVARQTVYEARLGLRELEAGREMDCREAMRRLSEADGRVRRRRDIRAHLRSCPDCRAFRDSIESRRRDLQALAPLPAVAAASILQGLAGGKVVAGGGLGSATATASVGAGKVAGTSVAVKAVATVAVVATVGVTAADRGGLVDVGLPRGGVKSDSAKEAPTPNDTRHSPAPTVGGSGTPVFQRADIDARARAALENGRAGASHPAAPTSAKGPTESDADEGGGGAPTSLPTASQHGQETSAEHRSTNNKGGASGKDKEKNRSASSPNANANAKGPQDNAGKGETSKGKGKGQQQAPEEKPAKGQAEHAEAPGQAKKTEAPTAAGEVRGKGNAGEPEPSP